jgi:hypothetical protein
MTSIEKFHWLDQHPDYPNFVFARLRFGIPLDPEIAERALRLSLERQPLAYKHPVKHGRKWCWANHPNESECFTYRKLEREPLNWEFGKRERAAFKAYQLALVEFPHEGGVESEARFCSHHAASDGVASIKLINDWMTIYNNLVADENPYQGLSEVDQTKINQRGRLGLLQWNYLRHLPNQLIAIFGAAKFVFRKTAKLAARDSAPASAHSTPFPAIIGQWIGEEDYKRSTANARELEVSFTSACLTACFEAIDRWNQKAGAAGDRPNTSPWRILLPMSIRGRHDRTLPATNQTAIVQIDRCPGAEPDRRSLCRGIDREVKIIRRWQLEKMFLIAIRVASISNGWLKKIANNPDSRGAAVFTHLGQPYKRAKICTDRLAKTFPSVSDAFARPIDFDLAGPLRSGTPINFSFARHDRRMKITLHFDSKLISESDARQLLAMTVEMLQAC